MFDRDELLDLLDLAVIVRDVGEGRIVVANAAAARLAGVPREVLVGTRADDHHWDLVDLHGREVPVEGRPFAVAVATRAPVRDVLLGLRTPGAAERRWHLASAFPRLGPDGSVTHVALVVREVAGELVGEAAEALEAGEATRLVQRLLAEVGAARAAAAEQARFQASVIDAMQEGVVVHGRDGAIESANPAAERILGLAEAHLRGAQAVDPEWRLIDADGAPLPPDRIPSEVSRHTAAPCGPVLVGAHHGRGRRAWLRVSTSPVRDVGVPPGLPPRVVTTFIDVTAEEDAKRALEESRADIARLVAAVPGVLYRYLQDGPETGRFLFVSARATEVLGVTPEAMMASASALWERVVPADFAAVLADAASALDDDGGVREREFRVRMPDETVRWIRARALGERHEGGRLWTGVMTDVTGEKRLAEQLRHAQRREAIGDLTAGVAHNFNNLLAAILPNLELLRAQLGAETGAEARELIEEVERAAWAGADLVRQLMRISRRDATPAADAVRVGEVVRDVAALCRRSLGSEVDLRVEVDDPNLAVRLRASELHQVLLNLVLNARDALAGRGRGHIGITARSDGGPAAAPPDAVGYVVLRVQDDGCGMSQAVVERLGEPFFTTKPPDRGTGLGLATVYSIVRGAGGAIACTSAPGAGTTFELRLPRALAADTPPVEATGPRRPRRALDGVRVLVADDEPLVRTTVARMLKRAGCEVLEVSDGAQAVDLLGRRRDVDAVLLDVSMPVMGGTEALRAILARGDAPPVLMLTGDPSGRAFDGAAAVLDKPLGQRELIDAVARAVAEHRASHG
jgi:signal transduction histidine kinase/CheY-like chemotaxis protein